VVIPLFFWLRRSSALNHPFGLRIAFFWWRSVHANHPWQIILSALIGWPN
jgi:hypothetical protein